MEISLACLGRLGLSRVPGRCNLCLCPLITEAIEALPLANTPEVFGLHSNAEIGYYTQAARAMWAHLLELQPQTGSIYCEDRIMAVRVEGCRHKVLLSVPRVSMRLAPSQEPEGSGGPGPACFPQRVSWL